MQLGVPFDGLWLDAAVELRIARVSSKREHDASDADAAVAASQVEEPANAIDWRRIDAAGDFETVLDRARAELALEWEQSSATQGPQRLGLSKPCAGSATRHPAIRDFPANRSLDRRSFA